MAGELFQLSTLAYKQKICCHTGHDGKKKKKHAQNLRSQEEDEDPQVLQQRKMKNK